MKRVLLILVLHLTFAPCVFAHEARPAYLELRQTGPETYDVLWKVPALGDSLRLGIHVRFHADVRSVDPPRGVYANGAHVTRYGARRVGLRRAGWPPQPCSCQGYARTRRFYTRWRVMSRTGSRDGRETLPAQG